MDEMKVLEYPFNAMQSIFGDQKKLRAIRKF